ncbi:TraM recognition domain-containing protein [Hydrogenophaga aromaticivorans]|uniref:TraM recognition domain-containing protein n=1 Tax=Hydrogenophaga aromaticivorans TaxID=2610898 RepID=UPI000CC3BD89|nr:TraM recognition domain-containing protein [Hydrogenophaga aromaticivorans]MBQ0916861.1 TraM recognition domain-containing protein [Hydrogenophaga aromaticivorans]PKO59378.1 MAG: hypothetical protein CVU24_15430 [Betaproteobacteria bacterium HGW-Betaproteobacteria-18]
MQSPYEISRSEQIVDVRPWATRFAEMLVDPINLAMACGAMIMLTVLMPVLMFVTLPLVVVMLVASSTVGALLPLRYPPGTKTPEGKPGDGILYYGNMDFEKERSNRLPLENPADRFKEVWGSDDDARKHALVLGSTGSGKSELLKGIFFNALCWGSGFFVADGKADNKLPLDNLNMARFFGREDDVLALNFLLAGKTPIQVARSRRRRTNGTNPFSTADEDTIIQMGANLLPKVDGDAKNWQEKALNCWRGLVPALCWLRDNEGMAISVKTFVDYLALNKLEELYAKGYKLSLQNNGVWPTGFEGLKAYLEVGLPGFKFERCLKKHGLMPKQQAPGGKPDAVDQDATTYDQHGYRATQLNPALNLLDKTYGHIFMPKYSEIDMVDVTLNNRILVMLIPSLEKSAQEAESLGKLNVAVLRVMMGKNLGAEIEGTRRQILESKATEARYPYIVALDELGYYFADGIAVMFAQARSLGFSMIAAAQDIEKLTEGARAAEAGAMLANQVTKIFMRIDDANKTNEMIQKYLDKVTVALRRSYEHQDGFGFKKLLEVNIEEIPIATLKNLQSLKAGRAIINSMGRTFKMKSFYVGGFLEKYQLQDFHINRFLQVRGLTQAEVDQFSTPVDALNDPYVKGQKLKDSLTGHTPPQDLRAHAETQPYAQAHDRALEMVNAVAAALKRSPPGTSGARRAIIMYEAAREFLGHGVSQGPQGRSSGAQALADRGSKQNHMAIAAPEEGVTPEAALRASAEFTKLSVPGGDQIEDGSGSGEGLASPSAVDDDPFSFLNEDRPLVRKPAVDVIRPAGGAPASSLAHPALAHAHLVEVDSGGEVVLPAEDEIGAGLPAFLVGAVESMLEDAQDLAFDVHPEKPAEKPAAAATDPGAQWIGQALSSAATALNAKGETLVGLTDRAKESFHRLESTLGNASPDAATAAIEQIVSQQTTPSPMDPTAAGADFSDLDMLLNDFDSSSS